MWSDSELKVVNLLFLFIIYASCYLFQINCERRLVKINIFSFFKSKHFLLRFDFKKKMKSGAVNRPKTKPVLDQKNEETRSWLREEVNQLIELWETYSEHLKKIKCTSIIYRRIAFRLQQRLHRKVPYTEKDVRNKIKTLRRQYRYWRSLLRSAPLALL